MCALLLKIFETKLQESISFNVITQMKICMKINNNVDVEITIRFCQFKPNTMVNRKQIKMFVNDVN